MRTKLNDHLRYCSHRALGQAVEGLYQASEIENPEDETCILCLLAFFKHSVGVAIDVLFQEHPEILEQHSPEKILTLLVEGYSEMVGKVLGFSVATETPSSPITPQSNSIH